MSYLRAVLNDNTKLEERYLKELVYIGKKLNIDTKKYKHELKKFSKANKSIQKTKIIQPKKVTKKPTSTNSKYNIKSVYTKNGNMIVINFRHKISNKDINYFEQHFKYLHKDVFHLKGKF